MKPATREKTENIEVEGKKTRSVYQEFPHLRNTQTYFNARPYPRENYKSLTKNAVSLCLLNSRELYSGSIEVLPQGDERRRPTLKTFGGTKPRAVECLCRSDSNEEIICSCWSHTGYSCSVCEHYIRKTLKGHLIQVDCCASSVLKMPSEGAITKPHAALRTENTGDGNPPVVMLEHVSRSTGQRLYGRDNERLDNQRIPALADAPPDSFKGILNNLAYVLVQVVYNVFLVIAGMLPVLGIFSAVCSFCVNSINEIRNTENRRDHFIKSIIFGLQIMAIVISIVFVLCAVFIPIVMLGRTMVRKLFFFV